MSARCKFGPTEHDGSRFCHEHAGRVHAGSPTPWACDKADPVQRDLLGHWLYSADDVAPFDTEGPEAKGVIT